MTQPDSSCTRRRLLLVAPVVLAAFALPACAKKEPHSCASTLGLTQDEVKTRTSLGYKDRSPDPKKHCSLCTQYVPPPKADECGTCKVMKGPVHSKGSCNVFTPKATRVIGGVTPTFLPNVSRVQAEAATLVAISGSKPPNQPFPRWSGIDIDV